MRFRAFRAFYLARTSIDLAAHHAEFFGIRGSAAMHKLSCVAHNRHLVRAGAVGGDFSSLFRSFAVRSVLIRLPHWGAGCG